MASSGDRYGYVVNGLGITEQADDFQGIMILNSKELDTVIVDRDFKAICPT